MILPRQLRVGYGMARKALHWYPWDPVPGTREYKCSGSTRVLIFVPCAREAIRLDVHVLLSNTGVKVRSIG
eukprot:1342104-Rhodomonas_salina.1